jgi:PmbA protein
MNTGDDGYPLPSMTINCERLLSEATRAGCREAEVFVDRHVQTPVAFERGQLTRLEVANDFLLSLRCVSQGRVGFAVTNRPEDYAVVERAIRTAAYGPPADFEFASPEQASGARDLPLRDRALENLTVDSLIDTGQELVDASLEQDPSARVSIRLQRWMGEMRLINSAGVDVSFRRGFLAVHLSAEVAEADGILKVYQNQGVSRLEDLDMSRFQDEYLRDLAMIRTKARRASGPCRVLFESAAASDLLTPISAAVNGQTWMRGVSPWLSHLDRDVLASGLSLVDDATIPHGTAAAPYDDEGVATRPTILIDKGILRGVLSDLRTASKLGRPPSGHGYRSGAAPPAPGRSNWVVAPGTIEPGRLLDELGEGVLVKFLMGAGGANPLTGEVGGSILLGYLVQNGEIAGRVSDCLLRLNAFEALRHGLVGLGSDRRWTLSNCFLPPIIVEGANLTAGKPG